jgi:hypothetical protein
MLRVLIRGDELYDEATNRFTIVDDATIELEHSLISLSKWESIHQKPFLGAGQKTSDEILSYVKAMVLNNVDLDPLFPLFTQENYNDINAYIDSKQSATTFGMMPERPGRGETITAELIYYWMVAFNIPFECERWHLNRLFALIRICNIKNSKPKRMSKHEMATRNRELNMQRRAQLNSPG